MLHVHDFDHDHVSDEVAHAHVNEVHIAYDTSHDEHHVDIVSEVDISPDGMLKNFSNNLPTLALFAFLFALVLSGSSSRVVHRFREAKPMLYGRYVLSPPLRAPPQH